MLNEAQKFAEKNNASNFRFIHVSTDEVYGSLGDNDPSFTEETAYAPNSPYSASKAGSDHLARAWFHTFKFPVITTHCSNNYGPFQHEEKLIPLMIKHAIQGKKLPVYGTGKNIRDWIHVEDHVEGLVAAWKNGKPGEVYNFGGETEVSNIDLVKRICAIMDELKPIVNGTHEDLIEFVEDRKGHDFRYAISNTKSNKELKWSPKHEFTSSLKSLIKTKLELS